MCMYVFCAPFFFYGSETSQWRRKWFRNKFFESQAAIVLRNMEKKVWGFKITRSIHLLRTTEMGLLS